MRRLLGIALVFAALFGSSGCGFMDHLLGVPEAAPALGTALPIGPEAFFNHRLHDTEPGRCIPPDLLGSDWTECDDTAEPEPEPVPVEQLAGIWVEASYGAAAIHVDPVGLIYQVDLADVIAGKPLPSVIPNTLFNVGQLTTSADGLVTADVDIALAGFSVTAQGVGFIDVSLNAIYNMNIEGTMTILGEASAEYVPYVVWLRWDPVTDSFPFLSNP